MKRLLIAWCLGCVLAATAGCYEIPPGGKPPQPKPPIPSITKVPSLWIVTIDEWSDRAKPENQSQTQLLTDTKYWKGIDSRGHHHFILDAASGFVGKNYTRAVSSTGVPCVVLFDASNRKELAAVKLPKDEAGMDALIKEYSDK